MTTRNPNTRRDDRRSCRSRWDDRRTAIPNVHLEQFCEPSCRPLSRTACRQPLRHRTCRRSAARAAGDLPEPKWLFADRSSDVEACAGASRTNRLQNREHHYGRWHRDGRGEGARQSWPAVAGLGRVRRRRRRKALSHELASRELFRRALLRNDASDGCHRSRTSRVDMGRLIVRSMCTLSAIPLSDRGRHHSSVPTNAVTAAARSDRPGRPNGRREAASPWTVAGTVACSASVGIAACGAVAAVLFAVLTVASPNEPNRILSKLFAVWTVSGWEQGQSGRGWQGKSAAFGSAHVVDGVEVLRGDESGHAVAARRNLRQINPSRAVGLRKLAVRCHESSAIMTFASVPDAFATVGVACRVRRALSARSCGPQRRQDMSATALDEARAVRAGPASAGAGVLRSPCRCDRPHDVW